jgi:hypothetical protein
MKLALSCARTDHRLIFPLPCGLWFSLNILIVLRPAVIMLQEIDHRMVSIKPRLKYNTIGGVNGPLVILDNVSRALHNTLETWRD